MDWIAEVKRRQSAKGGNLPYGLAPSGSLSSYTPTMRERGADMFRRMLFSDDRSGQQKAERLSDVLEYTPYGLMSGLYDAGRAGGQGDIGDAALLLGMAFAPGPDVKKFRGFKGMHPYTDAGDLVDLRKGREQQSWKSDVNNAGFFASNPEVASHFANTMTRTGAVFPTELSFNKPLVIDGGGRSASEFQFENGRGVYSDKWNSYFDSNEYDGVILKNVKDAGGLTDIYIPKDPEQIAHKLPKAK